MSFPRERGPRPEEQSLGSGAYEDFTIGAGNDDGPGSSSSSGAGIGSDAGSSAKFAYSPPIDWWKLDPYEQVEVLEALAVWVGVLARKYGIRESILPPCWFLHEAMVQELLALFQYRNQQQFLPVSPPGAALDFHVQLGLALSRLRSWVQVTNCNQRDHNSSECSAWARNGSDTSQMWRDGFDAYVKTLTTGLENLGETGTSFDPRSSDAL